MCPKLFIWNCAGSDFSLGGDEAVAACLQRFVDEADSAQLAALALFGCSSRGKFLVCNHMHGEIVVVVKLS